MKSFLQTKKWADFQKSLGADYFFIDSMLVVKYGLPFGKHYLYIPRTEKKILFPLLREKGLISTSSDKKPDSNFQKAIFLRVEPKVESGDTEFIKELKAIGFIKINQESQPSKTLILDIAKEEDELLDKMHHKTRYNIRLAEKKGVAIEVKNNLDQNEFNVFWELIKKTSKRDGFISFHKEYYKKLFDVFCEGEGDPRIKIVLGKHKNNIIAVAVIMFCGSESVYLHGASDYKRRNLMAPYLIQWSAILEAKKKGCKFYDFWGFDEKKWPGVTRFKKGFGGRVIEYIGTWDYVHKPFWYFGYRIGKKIKN
jgi:peptidoglycan pentaglycine glycine transferase (the first glycine)